MHAVRQWFSRHINDPQVVGLVLVLLFSLAVITFLGPMLAPVLAALIMAYLLEGMVRVLERLGLLRIAAVIIVFLCFIAFLLVFSLVLIPQLSGQLATLVDQMPQILNKGRDALLSLPQQYPGTISEEQVRSLMALIGEQTSQYGRSLLASFSLRSLVVVFAAVVYLILVPFMVFFFLKDKVRLLHWVKGFLPEDSGLTYAVWRDVDMQIGNYVRGKFLEIFIVGGVSFLTFELFGLQYAMLLAVIVGLSVIVPYIGATVVTLPVAVIAYTQWGASELFAWLMIAYLIIQALDGNVLVPLLFSEVVNLHPVAIIAAILVFGGIWGFWGVFFAIPLATVIQAVLKAWPQPRPPEIEPPAGEGP